jgi:hypothetical protein
MEEGIGPPPIFDALVFVVETDLDMLGLGNFGKLGRNQLRAYWVRELT